MRYKNIVCYIGKIKNFISLKIHKFSLGKPRFSTKIRKLHFSNRTGLIFTYNVFWINFIITHLGTYVLLRTQSRTFILSFGRRKSKNIRTLAYRSLLSTFLTFLGLKTFSWKRVCVLCAYFLNIRKPLCA